MKLQVLDKENVKKNDIELPSQFSEEIREDLIQKAVYVIQNNKRQPYGAKIDAGMRHSSYLSKRRHKYKSTYGIGQSRTPRKVMTSRGTRFFFVGATAPQTVGGREAHPPKAEKIWAKSMNTKERRKAIRAAMTATLIKELVEKRGHKAPDNYPFALDSSIESFEKTRDVNGFLKKVGFDKELIRTKQKKVRAGKGTMRGRRYKKKIGPLIIVSKNCKLLKAGANLPGVDVVKAKDLNAELLAPGCDIARVALFTEAAINEIKEKKMFI